MENVTGSQGLYKPRKYGGAGPKTEVQIKLALVSTESFKSLNNLNLLVWCKCVNCTASIRQIPNAQHTCV